MEQQDPRPQDPSSTHPEMAPSAPSPFEPYPDDRAERRSRWRVVFGILSLVVGVLGFCMQGIGTVFATIPHKLFSGGFEMPAPPDAIVRVAVVQFALLAVLGFMLVIGSAMLLRRDPRGRKLVLAWAIGRLIMVVAGLAVGIAMVKPQVEWQISLVGSVRETLRKDPNIKEDQLPKIPEREAAEAQAVRMLGIVSLAFATWPFVMAIVLTRPFVRDEVESWRGPRAAADPLA